VFPGWAGISDEPEGIEQVEKDKQTVRDVILPYFT